MLQKKHQTNERDCHRQIATFLPSAGKALSSR